MTSTAAPWQPPALNAHDLDNPTQPVVRSFVAMGCQMALTLVSADPVATELAFDAGHQQIEQYEACLSRFRTASELTRLNARADVDAGGWTPISPVLAAVLRVALQAARRSGGLCTPTLLDALEAAGYDRDFAQLDAPAVTLGHRVAHPGAKMAPRRRGAVAMRRLRGRQTPRARTASWRAIRLVGAADDSARVRLPRGMHLDLAGVAKGWTADRVAERLAHVGPCLIDAGGDLAARGAPPGLSGWPVAVADPFQPDADLALILLRDAGIATSGIDARRWSHHGRPQHHLIDPRTGEPSRTSVLTVSVVARTAAEADVHAKTALLLGVRRGLAYLADKHLAGLVVRRDGRALTTPHWSDYAIPT